jgi:isopentenyl-diphosphate delta-isomerase
VTEMDDCREMLILVDDNDREIAFKDKESCHLIPAALHRAFSIFIVNSQGEMLIHKRQRTKMTWPGYWTNACCSHPRKGEALNEAARRRLTEELGIACDVEPLFKFHYKADYDATYGEHEVDHVFLGIYDGDVKPNIDEIEEHRFMSIDRLMDDLKARSDEYTPWFIMALPGVLERLHALGKV